MMVAVVVVAMREITETWRNEMDRRKETYKTAEVSVETNAVRIP